MTYPVELTPELRTILGMSSLTCGLVAKRLREIGEEIPNKTSDEQASTIHWLIGLYLDNPETWETVAHNILVGKPGSASTGPTTVFEHENQTFTVSASCTDEFKAAGS